MKRILSHFLLYTGLVTLTIWAIGFCAFVLYALSFKFADPIPTDAIVVLTGGTDRIDTGIRLLEEKNANYLLISGVNKQVFPNDILKKVPPQLIHKVTLGYLAETTAENAEETSIWIQNKKISSILLVTSFYHMPRSIFELSKRTPDLTIATHPVFPKSFGDSVDWIKTRYAWLLFIEYHKFLTVHLKHLISERITL